MVQQKVILSLLTFVLVAITVSLLYWYTRENTIEAIVYPRVALVGQTIHVSDSTHFAKQWRWDFGFRVGDSLVYKTNARDSIRFYKEGRYLIRLTVNNTVKQEFLVTVLPLPKVSSQVSIEGPSSGYERENLVFKAVGGHPRSFSWRFGESNLVDSYDQTAIYSYSAFSEVDLKQRRPYKTFTIELTTDASPIPIKRKITIYRAFYRFQTPPSPLDSISNDIQQRLQRIADGQPFNPNYGHVLSTYLCRLPAVPVKINSQKENDFYSYCMSLHFDRGMQIDGVTIDADSVSHCVKKIYVTQHKP